MATLDKITRLAIADAVKAATISIQEVYEEKWVTGAQLCKEMPFFTKDWLQRYGHKLCRESVSVLDKKGVSHKTKYCYPLKKIMRQMAEGELRMLKL